jgi:hypothetical protein
MGRGRGAARPMKGVSGSPRTSGRGRVGRIGDTEVQMTVRSVGVRTWLRRLAAVAVAAASFAGGAPAEASLPQVEPPRLVLTGPGAISVKHVVKSAETVSTRFAFGDPGFDASVIDGPALTGTYTLAAPQSVKRVCVLTQPSLDAFAAWLGSRISLAIPDLPAVAVTVDSYTMVVSFGPTRPARKLAATFNVHVSVNGGTAVAGTYKLKGNAVPRRVLVLDDGAAGQIVEEALRAAHHVPLHGGRYYEWDGLSPSLDEVETVIFLEGQDYGRKLTPTADALLASYVRAGGGLVRTEWAAYDYAGSPGQAVDALMPVEAPKREYAYEGAVWKVTERKHPLVKGFPARFALTKFGSSDVVPIQGATVVAELTRTAGTFPAITFAAFGDGTVVHVNHYMNEKGGAIPAVVLKMLVNAVAFTAP